MKRTWFALFVFACAVVALAVTKDRWLPSEVSREWHREWLLSGKGNEDPREEALEEHTRLTAEMERDLQEQIDREKKMNEILRLEYERLSQERGSG